MSWIDDLRLALRTLRRSPGFTLVVIATLTLALGAGVALFSLVDAVLLEPLPFAGADRLVALWDSAPADGIEKFRVTAFNFGRWRERAHGFERMALYASSTLTLRGRDEPIRLEGSRVSEDFFPLLGVTPALGRGFEPADFRPGAESVIVLSHALWSDRFGGDPEVVGRPVRLDETTYTVVGVMPRRLLPLTAWASGRVEMSATAEFYWLPFAPELTNARSHVYGVLGRLRPGVAPADAAAELRRIAEELAAELPGSNRGYTVAMVPLRKEAVGEVAPALWLLLGAVGLVLLVACANVGGLLLARADARRKELAVRAALGAGRVGRLRGLLAEGALLAAAGGGLGTLAAAWAVRLLPRISPADVPRIEEAVVDGRALAVAIAATVVCGLAFLLAPALATPRNLEGELRAGGRPTGAVGGGLRLRRFLVAAETALAVVLVLGAGLLVRSFARLQAVDPGFDAGPTLTVELLHAGGPYGEMHRLTGLYDELLGRLGSLPGVEGVAAAYDPPLASNWRQGFRVADAPPPAAGEGTSALFRTVTPGYFETLGIDLLRGRTLRPGDGSSAAGAVVVNEAFARAFFPDREAVGRELVIGTTQWMWGDAIPTTFHVVGVVADEKFAGLAAPSEAAFYLPFAQTPQDHMTLLLRTRGRPTALLPAVRRTIHEIDPELPIGDVSTLDAILSAAVARPRFDAGLLTGFAVAALALAMMGTAAVVGAGVARRRHEIGVRMALGSRRSGVVALVLGQGVRPVLAGTAVGIAGALALARLLRGLLFEVSPTDPAVYLAVPILLLAIAAAACVAPARRAVRVDPVEVLRGG